MAAQTYVYIMTCRKAVKIGISRNLPHRLRHIRNANPERVELAWSAPCPAEDAKAIEATVHETLRAEGRGMHGEWFRASVAQAQAEISRAIAGHRCHRPPSADQRDAYFNVIQMYRSAG